MQTERFQYHFEPKRGWMNDPNGLIFYKGEYHAFFQYNPHAAHWGPMHWGHAVSRDLIHWEEYPIALYPDEPYEDAGGCFSGSAVEKDGKMYLFYTSVSKEYGQTQSVAISEDGVNFVKYKGNPIIRKNPLGHDNFRDPKVTKIGDTYYMVVGSGDREWGQVLLFSSSDLLHWEYETVLFGGKEYADCIECPDFFRLGDKYVLMFSKIKEKFKATYFVVGDFVENKLVNYTIQNPERGYDFYAPQTFEADGRRIMIGWMYHWGKVARPGAAFAGALSIPRELSLENGRILNYPVSEAKHLMDKCSDYVIWKGDTLDLRDGLRKWLTVRSKDIRSVDILEDTKSVEVFINGGKQSYTYWKRGK